MVYSQKKLEERIRLHRESGVDWIDLMSELRFYARSFHEHADSSSSTLESKEWRLRSIVLLKKLSQFTSFIEDYGVMMDKLEEQ